jgi:hypothetical protein
VAKRFADVERVEIGGRPNARGSRWMHQCCEPLDNSRGVVLKRNSDPQHRRRVLDAHGGDSGEARECVFVVSTFGGWSW